MIPIPEIQIELFKSNQIALNYTLTMLKLLFCLVFAFEVFGRFKNFMSKLRDRNFKLSQISNLIKLSRSLGYYAESFIAFLRIMRATLKCLSLF